MYIFHKFCQGSQAYVQAIEKVGIVTAAERDSILGGLEQVSNCICSICVTDVIKKYLNISGRTTKIKLEITLCRVSTLLLMQHSSL